MNCFVPPITGAYGVEEIFLENPKSDSFITIRS